MARRPFRGFSRRGRGRTFAMKKFAKRRFTWIGQESGCETATSETQDGCPSFDVFVDVLDRTGLQEGFNDRATVVRIIGGLHVLPTWDDADDALNSTIAWKWCLKTFDTSDDAPEGVKLNLFTTAGAYFDYTESKSFWLREKLTSSGLSASLGTITGNLSVPVQRWTEPAHDVAYPCLDIVAGTGGNCPPVPNVCIECTQDAFQVVQENYTAPFTATVTGGSSVQTRWTRLSWNTRKRMPLRENQILQVNNQAYNVTGPQPDAWQVYGGWRALVEF